MRLTLLSIALPRGPLKVFSLCKATSESWPLRRMGAAKSVLSGHRATATQGKESSDDSEDLTLASEKKHAFEPCHPTTRPLAGQQPTAARHERGQSSVTSLHAVYEEVLELQSAAPTLEPSALLLRRTAAAAVMPNLAPTTGEEKPAVFKVSPVSVIERGHGVHTSPDGQRYEGEWRDSKAHGQGEHTWPNGERYAGEFAEDTMSGRGVHTWSDGERYEGEFLDDLMHGRGSYTWITGKHYQGDFFEDKMHGRGECTWPSGQRYDGEWRDGKAHGRGTCTWPNGRRYDGEWRSDTAHGSGVCTFPSGTYDCNFVCVYFISLS